MEFGGFEVVEGPQQDLPGAAAEERAFFTEHLTLHEAEVGPAEDEHDAAGLGPMTVPQLLDDGRQLSRALGHPLKLIEGEDELLFPRVAFHDEVERLAPAAHAGLGEQRLIQRTRSGLEKLGDLRLAGGAFADEVDAGLLLHEMDDHLALADTAAAIDGQEHGVRPAPHGVERGDLTMAAPEISHGGS
jgi:hypothetical protein